MIQASKLFIPVAILLSAARVNASETINYFPKELSNSYSNGYAHRLEQMQEPSLCCLAKRSGRDFRFLWLRTFDQPVLIRISERADQFWDVTVKLSEGQSGFGIDQKVISNQSSKDSTSQVQKLLTAFEPHGSFWTLPTYVKKDILDGSTWLIEARSGERYHFIVRRSPESGWVYQAGLMFIAISGLTDQRIY